MNNVKAPPLDELCCLNCKLYKTKDCPGLLYKDVYQTGQSYCFRIFNNFDPERHNRATWLDV